MSGPISWEGVRINSLHLDISMHILHTVLYLYIFWGADKENLFNNQELLKLVNISSMLGSVVIL